MTDFGLSKELADPEEGTTTFCGTPEYIGILTRSPLFLPPSFSILSFSDFLHLFAKLLYNFPFLAQEATREIEKERERKRENMGEDK